MATKPSRGRRGMNPILIKGSAALSAEFFSKHIVVKHATDVQSDFPMVRCSRVGYAVSSILFQRGIYPPDMFSQEQKYGMILLVPNDEDLNNYLNPIFSQVQMWLECGHIERLALVIRHAETNEVVERWQFNVEMERMGNTTIAMLQSGALNGTMPNMTMCNGTMMDCTMANETTMNGERKEEKKTDAQIRQEMSAILKQILASVSFLPLNDFPSSFELLVYTDNNTEIPAEWKETTAHYIPKSQHVRLRSFSTNVHKVDSVVAYKLDE